MARTQKTYRTLASNSRFIRGLGIDAADSEIPKQERIDAEDLAAIEIDSALCKTFDVYPDAPPIVQLLGELLGSAFLYEFLALEGDFGEEGEARFKPEYLRKKADQILADLREHKRGIQAIDGTFDSDYPQPALLPKIKAGASKPITIDPGLAWGEMAQPVMSDAEKTALDTTRARRSDEAVAALAGAYGI